MPNRTLRMTLTNLPSIYKDVLVKQTIPDMTVLHIDEAYANGAIYKPSINIWNFFVQKLGREPFVGENVKIIVDQMVTIVANTTDPTDAAITVDARWQHMNITIDNYGSIMGRGGNGRGGVDFAGSTTGQTAHPNGLAGGTAILTGWGSLVVNNYNLVTGGGGGGGSGGSPHERSPYAASKYPSGAGGGGGTPFGLGSQGSLPNTAGTNADGLNAGRGYRSPDPSVTVGFGGDGGWWGQPGGDGDWANGGYGIGASSNPYIGTAGKGGPAGHCFLGWGTFNDMGFPALSFGPKLIFPPL